MGSDPQIHHCVLSHNANSGVCCCGNEAERVAGAVSVADSGDGGGLVLDILHSLRSQSVFSVHAADRRVHALLLRIGPNCGSLKEKQF